MKPQVFLSVLTLAALMLACNLLVAPRQMTPTVVAGEATKLPAENTLIPPVNTPSAALPTASPTPIPTENPTIILAPIPSAPMLTPMDKPVNCRFGPGVEYAFVGGLFPGETAPILGKNASGDWWYIPPPKSPDIYCWVAANVTVASGDLPAVSVLAPPQTFVTGVTLVTDPTEVTVPGCVFPYSVVNLTGTITSNGPAVVEWHWETSQGNVSATETLNFDQSGTKTVENYVKYGSDGRHWVELVVTSPNKLVVYANYRVMCRP